MKLVYCEGAFSCSFSFILQKRRRLPIVFSWLHIFLPHILARLLQFDFIGAWIE